MRVCTHKYAAVRTYGRMSMHIHINAPIHFCAYICISWRLYIGVHTYNVYTRGCTCMLAATHVYIIYKRIYTYIRVCTHIYANIHMSIYVRVFTYIYAHIRVCTHKCAAARMYTHIHIYAPIYVYLGVYMYKGVHTYIYTYNVYTRGKEVHVCRYARIYHI